MRRVGCYLDGATMNEIKPGDDKLQQLLQFAGPRPQPDEQLAEQVYAQVHATWRRRQQRRWMMPAAAAVLLSMLAVTLIVSRVPAPAPATASVATVERVIGELQMLSATTPHPVNVANDIAGDQQLRSGEGSGAVLRLHNGVELRLDQLTTITLATGAVHLSQGRIYVDTGSSAARIEVRTGSGVIRNTGTRFEVLANGTDTRVRVRDGQVQLETSRGNAAAQRGEALQVDGEGAIVRSEFAPTDPHWRWTWQLAAPFNTDQASVAELAEWVSNETGLILHYGDTRTHNAARITRLSGALDVMPPLQLLQTALLATRFEVQVADDTIVISRETPN